MTAYLEVFFDGAKGFNLPAVLGSGDATLTPPSYVGYPSGNFQAHAKCDSEIFVVRFDTTPWTLVRGQEGTTATSHVAGAAFYFPLTPGALSNLVGVYDGAGTLQATSQGLKFKGATSVSQVGALSVVDFTGQRAPLEFVFDGGGSVITTGSKALIEVAYACTILSVRLVADDVGSIQLTLKKCAYASLPTTVSIVASAHPTLSSARKSEDVTLTGWTTSLAQGDWLEYVVDSAALVQRVTCSLVVART